MATPILTVGHSNRSTEDFIRLLRTHGVTVIADVRKMPGSRRNPQFNEPLLRAALAEAGIAYVRIPALGGLRRSRRESANTAWENASFRAYADYMESTEFEAGLNTLVELRDNGCMAVMCAEAVPWRCHRSLIADALVARGIPVEHVMSETRRQPHTLRSFAHVDGGRVTYPAVG